MNAWTWVILCGLLVVFAVRRIVGFLEIRRLEQAREETGWTFYPESIRAESRSYGLAHLRLGQAAATVRLIVLLAFWFVGGFAALDDLVRALPVMAESEVARGVVFFGLLAVLGSAVSLPFRVHGTFVIEERFRFNRTTPRLFAADLVRGSVLGAILGGAAAAAALYLLGMGTTGWIFLWLLLGAFSLVMQVLVPRVIMPLFNRFDPLPEGALRDEILSYADQVDFPVGDVQVMDASKRSSKGNAFFTGTGRSRRVVLFDTLIDRHSVREVVAVFAHEVGHYKRGHIRRGLVVSFAYTGLALFLFAEVAGTEALSRAIGIGKPSTYAALTAFSLLMAPVGLLSGVLSAAFSRRRERQADDFATETTGDPGALAEALVRLGKDNLSDPSPHPAYVALNYSHPPLRERVGRLEGYRPPDRTHT